MKIVVMVISCKIKENIKFWGILIGYYLYINYYNLIWSYFVNSEN